MHSSALQTFPRLPSSPSGAHIRCAKCFAFIDLWRGGKWGTQALSFGAASAPILYNKEAANSSNMTYTLFILRDTTRTVLAVGTE